MSTTLEPIDFADGKYQFGPLSIKQTIELERACGETDRDGLLHPKSLYTLHTEFGDGLGLDDETPVYVGGGSAHPAHIRETIRLLLIAGGSGIAAGQQVEVTPAKAAQLCDDYVYPARPLVEAQYIAWAALEAMIRGVTLKKKVDEDPEAEGSNPSTED